MPEFDPYQEWLDIDPAERPADHYCLLGLARFETDVQRIARAADERMRHVRQFQAGPRGRHTQKLLNELAAARVCLLDATRKAAYDTDLAARIASQEAARRAAWDRRAPVPEVPPSQSIQPPPPLETTRPSRRATAPKPLFYAACLITAVLAIGGWSFWQRRAAPAPRAEARAKVAPQANAVRPAAPLLQPAANGEIAFPSPAWSEAGHAIWHFHVYKPGFFQAELTYATAEPFVEGVLKLQIDEQTRQITLRATGGLETPRSESMTVAVVRSGRHTLTLRLAEPRDAELVAVRTVRFIPVEQAGGP